MTKQKTIYKVVAPLQNFNWAGENFQVGDFCSIQKLDKIPDLSQCEEFLSQYDKEGLVSVSHWLSFEQSSTDELSPSEKINMFLLALWIVRPTRVHVNFRFELPQAIDNRQLLTYA